MKMNIVGCGRLGKAIGFLIARSNLVTIQDICNSSYESSVAAAKFIGSGSARRSISELSPADIYLVGTRDDKITPTCSEIITNSTPAAGSIFFHCSGSLSSDALASAKSEGHFVASMHPIKSFADPELSAKTFAGTLCGVEGDQRALSVLDCLFTKLGATCFPIEKNNKAIYHAAGVIANNYAVGLFASAAECYQLAGIDKKTANEITYMLFNGALTNLKVLSPEKALTGPLQRGDTSTISRHINALSNHPHLLELYKELGKATLPITNLPEQTQKEIQTLLSKDQIKQKNKL